MIQILECITLMWLSNHQNTSLFFTEIKVNSSHTKEVVRDTQKKNANLSHFALYNFEQK